MSNSSDPMDCSLPGFSVHGIFQARVLEWGAIAFSNQGPRHLASSIPIIQNCRQFITRPAVSFHEYLEMFTEHVCPALPVLWTTEHHTTRVSPTVATHSPGPNSSDSCHCCCLGQKLSSLHFLPNS